MSYDKDRDEQDWGRTFLDFAPLLEMSAHNLFCLHSCSRLLDSSDIQRTVLALEAAHTTHVVSVVRELVPCEAVF